MGLRRPLEALDLAGKACKYQQLGGFPQGWESHRSLAGRLHIPTATSVRVCMMNRLRAVRSRLGLPEHGQSIVELALVIPVLLLLLVGIIEVGRFAYYSILVANAARAGAQYGAQSLTTAADTTGITTAGQNDGQNVTGLTVTSIQQCGCNGASLGGVCPATGCAAPDHPLVYVQVTATGVFDPLFSYPGVSNQITVTSVEKMRVAQ
jgi:Flp pilus assembly protein TadG